MMSLPPDRMPANPREILAPRDYWDEVDERIKAETKADEKIARQMNRAAAK